MEKRTRDENKEYILKMAKDHDVKFIWLWFTDILGMLKSFAITERSWKGRSRTGWASTALPSRGLPASMRAT